MKDIFDSQRVNVYEKQLKDCPFCGTNNNLVFEFVDDIRGPKIVVACLSCNVRLPLKIDLTTNNMANLVNKWNTRP